MNFGKKFRAKLSVLISVLSSLILLCHATDTITSNAALTGDQTITSANGFFELGFFKPGNSSNYYIGIWYKKIPGQIIVWVANRDKPVTDKYFSSFRISDDGNLVLVSNMSLYEPVWSTYLSSNISKSTLAILSDKGNLMLRTESNSTLTLWQSFDHPTDTLLPGSKVAFNKKTKWAGVLTSWKNSEDPAPGPYTLECDPNSSQFIMLWNKTEQYWTSGVWISDQRIFSFMPELRFLPRSYSFGYVDNENESYLTFDYNSTLYVPRFVIDVSGIFKGITWFENTQKWVLIWSQPGQQCQAHAHCGAFSICNQTSLPYCVCLPGFEPKTISQWNLNDYSGGCARKTKLNCENPRSNGDKDMFWVSYSMILPDAPHFVSTSSLKDCEQVCLKNCSCTAYARDRKTCSIWFGDLLNVKKVSDTDSSGKTLYVRLATSHIQSTSGYKKWLVGVLVGVVIVMIFVFGVVFVVYWRKKKSLLIEAKSVGCSLKPFQYRELQSSTKNFSQRLGGGGFGSVFKGTLPDSTIIAVKKLERIGQAQGEKQFRTEVNSIGTIHHLNLVRLCGFCSEGKNRLLVYEYMPNGSLDTHLFRKKGSEILNWKLRYQIAIGVARGLAYLHEKCRDCIIHCDIKPENILLDDELCPKVADFGLAKLLGRDFSRVLTTIRGTRGYLAPEWISGEAITAKVDVYSYGMMLFEFMSGRRNANETNNGNFDFFPTLAIKKITRGEDVLGVLDPRLEGEAEKDEIMRMIKLACWCIQDDASQRPTMGQVIQVLERLLDIDMPSMPRSLIMFADDEDCSVFYPKMV